MSNIIGIHRTANNEARAELDALERALLAYHTSPTVATLPEREPAITRNLAIVKPD